MMAVAVQSEAVSVSADASNINDARLRGRFIWPILSLVAVAIAIGLRTQALSTVDCTFDECSSWRTISFEWPAMFDSIRRNVHPPVFYVCLKCWAYLFGDGVAALRWFAVCCGLLTLPAAAAFARMSLPAPDQKLAKEISIWTLLVMATNPLHVELCLQARMYSLGILLTFIAAVLLTRILREGGRAWEWIGFGLAVNLMLLTHYFCLMTATALAIVLLASLMIEVARVGFSSRAYRLLAGSSACLWATAIVWRTWLPVFRSQWNQVEVDYWIPAMTRSEFALAMGRSLTHQHAMISVWLCLLVAALALCVAYLAGCLCGTAGRIAAAAFLVPLLLVVVKGLTGQSLAVARYLSFAQGFLVVLFVMLSARIPSALWRRVFVLLLLDWNCWWVVDYSMHRWKSSADAIFQPLSAKLDEWQDDESPVIVSTPQNCIKVKRYSKHPEQVFVVDLGYAYAHYQAGPLLNEVDYLSVADLSSTTDRWLAIEWPRTSLGTRPVWQESRSVEFQHPVRSGMTLVLREYVRSGESSISPAQ